MSTSSKIIPEKNRESMSSRASTASTAATSTAGRPKSKQVKFDEEEVSDSHNLGSLEDEVVKWRYMEHHGVQFPAEYEPQGLKIIWKSEKIELNAIQEEICYYWAQFLGTDWETKPEYRKNFTKLLVSTLDRKIASKIKLEDLDFSEFTAELERKREARKDELQAKKSWTPEKKQEAKAEKEKKDATMGYAIVDKIREKVGGYTIEPPTLFKGRGQHPKSGYFKPRVYPEDVTLNFAESAPVPKCNLRGHAWGDIVHNPKVTWLAYYREEAITGSYKYFFLAANSRMKAQSDIKKYEKARKLKVEITKIRADYMQKAQSSSLFDRQLGTVAYFIDKLALRVGNEKNDEEEADTVGCCSLRFEHVEALPGLKVKFDFPGKDSMRYENTVDVDKVIHRNIQEFLRSKSTGDNLFEQVNPTKFNEYLSSLMDSLTAKVFRTFNASSTLDRELAGKIDDNLALEEKVKFYNDANKKVALLCNHQKTVNKDFDQKLEKWELKVKEIQDHIGELKRHLALVERGKQGLNDSQVAEFTTIKLQKKFPVTAEGTREAIAKMQARMQTEKYKLDEKVDTKNVALGTSKINYNDPRITVAWCKRNEVPIEKVFSKELRSKFTWAMEAASLWTF